MMAGTGFSPFAVVAPVLDVAPPESLARAADSPAPVGATVVVGMLTHAVDVMPVESVSND